ncbi:MAG: hypothetical protein QME57_05180 [Patescibacteria group bacterium]|nr:hypothetical protein [Patescibacteria group bacterium]
MSKVKITTRPSSFRSLRKQAPVKGKKFFIGIDLGWKEKRTTGLCILEKGLQPSYYPSIPRFARNRLLPVLLKDVFGKDVLKTINPYLKETKVIAIDAPLTQGRGKGKMRLYEKFLSTSIFRKEKVNPLPPALISKLSDFAREIVKKLEKKGFVLSLNLVETFPTLVKKVCGANLNQFLQGAAPCQTDNQRSALICAILAFLHFNFKTCYLGYKDGFLFLPEIAFWKKDWRQKFYQAWKNRPRVKYHRLITNLFK